MKPSIFSLPQLVESLPRKKQQIFSSIFSYTTDDVPFLYENQTTRRYLAKRFHTRSKNLLSRKTIGIRNWVFSEQTFFNPLRTTRPMQNGQEKVTPLTPKDCDFCHAKTKTPADPFGRIETSLSITAANASAYVGLHSLVIPKTIHALSDVSGEIFFDMMDVANRWFAKAHAYDSSAIFPSIIWNSSARSGASVFHPHIQLFLTQEPFQRTQSLYEKSCAYEEKNSKPFFREFAKIMDFLGLAHWKNSSIRFAHLTPFREREVMLMGKTGETSLPHSFIETSYSLYRWYTKKLGVQNFNMGIMLPPLNKKWLGFPILLRLVDRGIDGKPSDFAGLELFFASVVGSDPYQYIPMI